MLTGFLKKLFVAGTGIEPVFAPWKGAVLADRRTGRSFYSGRKNRFLLLHCQNFFFEYIFMSNKLS